MTKAVNFAEKTHFTDNTLFISDSEYKAPDPNCGRGYGALYTYKQQSGNWSQHQLFLPDEGSTENKFARHFSYKLNLLVCSAERENHSSNTPRAGAIYVYRRSSWGGNFTRVAKVFAPSPSFGGEYAIGGVATNGIQIVVYDRNQSQLYLYTASGYSVNLVGSMNIGNDAGTIQGITDQGIVIVQNESSVRLFKAHGNGFTEISDDQILPSGNWVLGGRASVDGNSAVFETYNVFGSGSRWGGIRVVKFGSDNVQNVSDINFSLGLSFNNYNSVDPHINNRTIKDVYIKENKGIAVSFYKRNDFSYRNRVALLNYVDGQYRMADVVSSPRSYFYEYETEEWGASVALSGNNLLFVGDPEDKTNDNLTGNQCTTQNPSGALYVYDIQTPENGPNNSKVFTTTFPERHNYIGRSLAISGNYALLGHDLAKDVEENGGAVSILKKVNGEWQFIKKIHSINGQQGEVFGVDVDITDKFAAIGTRLGNNRGAVQLYHVLSSSGEKIEDVDAHRTIVCPVARDHMYFGGSVSIEGDYLAVGATGDVTKGLRAGAVFIYHWNGSNWSLVQKIVPDKTADNQYFGSNVKLKGGLLITMGVDDSKGVVYSYRWNGSAYVNPQKIFSPISGENGGFGSSISVGENYMAVTNSNYYNNNNNNRGMVALYRKINNFWYYEHTIIGENYHYIGADCALEGSRLIVSSGIHPKKVYRFERNNGVWQEVGAIEMDWTISPIKVGLSGNDVLIGDSFYDDYHGRALMMNFHSISGARYGYFDEDDAEDLKVQSGFIYPNPASGGKVTISGTKEIQKIEAYSSHGVLQGQLSFDRNEVDVSSLKPGLYVLYIYDKEGLKSDKLMIE
ncbi:T9SS type A sorting domain-containing protein [Cytophagaceae bacterium ABcell3]|nr:T9SS type A sorting domain-containing protein [Cytophagaceae bacterium ABcell3]